MSLTQSNLQYKLQCIISIIKKNKIKKRTLKKIGKYYLRCNEISEGGLDFHKMFFEEKFIREAGNIGITAFV